MPKNSDQALSGVTETLLITLYVRAIESQRPDALVRDEKAVSLVRQLEKEYDFSRISTDVDEFGQIMALLRNREIDRLTQDFLKRNPEAVIVHAGCGLDARFERVDNGRVEWYDLDLPEVIALRRKLIGGEGGRHQFLAGSVLDSAWMETVSRHGRLPLLFLAEGLMIYLEEAQVKTLVLALKDRFPGAELVFDGFSPFFIWANNLRVRRTGVGARALWALKRGRDLERWGKGIRLLEESFPFTYPEPRLLHSPRIAQAPWVLRIPLFAKMVSICHFRLGNLPDGKGNR